MEKIQNKGYYNKSVVTDKDNSWNASDEDVYDKQGDIMVLISKT
jgi:hypothetical protein